MLMSVVCELLLQTGGVVSQLCLFSFLTLLLLESRHGPIGSTHMTIANTHASWHVCVGKSFSAHNTERKTEHLIHDSELRDYALGAKREPLLLRLG